MWPRRAGAEGANLVKRDDDGVVVRSISSRSRPSCT
jgi:hypothetical protein